MKHQVRLTAIFIFFASICYGQMDQYQYQRELTGINNTWHSIILPNDLFGQLKSGAKDLRVYGITSDNDTIEAPYIFKTGEDINNIKEEKFNLLNTSNNDNGYYFTYEIISKNPINQIQLNFLEKNFDWKIKLEGTQNRKEWFTIVDDYRILSIQNKDTDYQFTNISFPESQYRYFRLLVKAKEKPNLESASILLNSIKAGQYRNCPILKKEIIHDKEMKRSFIHIDLGINMPIHSFDINIENKNDYYRRIDVEYLVDSTKTDKGMKYHYKKIYSGTLHSINPNDFIFDKTMSRQFKITIYNLDNEPLNIGEITAKGYTYQLNTRFDKPAKYYLAYGNKWDNHPSYDIEQFADKIPEQLTALQLGTEINTITEKANPKSTALFENPAWLWGIMILIILIMGGFTVSMMKKR